jgi:hypothetical protein
MLESPKLTPFTLQLNQEVFTPNLSDHQRSKPINQDMHLLRCGARHHENQGQCLFWDMHFITYANGAPELLFKK